MRRILKRFSFLKTFSKKWVFLVLLIFTLVCLIVPLDSAYAIWNPIRAIVSGIAAVTIGGPTTALVSIIFQLWLVLGEGLLTLVVNPLLHWALGNPFTYSYTNPATNPVIEIGWTLLRDFTNMFFVLGLAYIGLATSLGAGGFNTKKTFKNLIIVALLINFTPVICGLIVDAANVVTHFFTQDIHFAAIGSLYTGTATDVAKAIAQNLLDPLQVLKIALLLGYTYTTIAVNWLYIFLFLARNVAIWILVIVSPFAFFCWIFDGTKKYFQQWWGQFIQWVTIGIPAGFFLYLSSHLLSRFSQGGLTKGELTGGFGEIFAEFAPFIIVLLFMIAGFIVTLQTASRAGAASYVLKGAKLVGKKAIKGSAALAKKGAKGLKNLGARKEKVGAAGRYMFSTGTEEEEARWGATGLKRFTRRMMQGFGVTAAVGRMAGSYLEEDTRKGMAATKAKAKDKSVDYQKRLWQNAKLLSTKLALAAQISEDGNWEDMGSEAQREQWLEELIEKGAESNPAALKENIRLLDPKVTERIYNEKLRELPEELLKKAGIHFDLKKDVDAGFKSLEEKLVATMKPKNMNLWTEDIAKRYADSDAIHKFWSGQQVGKAGEEFGTAFLEKFQEGVDERGEEFYKKNNPKLYNYLDSTGARTLGIGLRRGEKGPIKRELTPEEKAAVKERYKPTTEMTAEEIIAREAEIEKQREERERQREEKLAEMLKKAEEKREVRKQTRKRKKETKKGGRKRKATDESEYEEGP